MAMDFLDVEIEVKNILVEKYNCSDDRTVLASRLRQDLGLNDVEVIEMIAEAEEECGVSIPQDELPEILTVGDLVKKLQQSIPD
jgi:acyl carrier protein